MTRTTAIVADLHAPEQDNRAVELACRIIQDCKPDNVIINGDSEDFREASTFTEAPDVRLLLQRSIDEAYKKHTEIKSAASGAKFKFIIGNHEVRWLRYLMNHPVIYSLEALTLEELLKLKELEFEFVRDEVELVGGRLIVTHGIRYSKYAGRAVEKEIADRMYQQSVIIGHNHKVGTVTARGPRLAVGGWEIGCLQKLEPHYKKHPNWTQGIGVLSEWGNADSQHFSVENLIFTGKGDNPRRCIFRGKEYEVK